MAINTNLIQSSMKSSILKTIKKTTYGAAELPIVGTLAAPILTTLPAATMLSKSLGKSMNKMSEAVNPKGTVMYAGKHGFVQSNAIGLPFYLNKTRRVTRF